MDLFNRPITRKSILMISGCVFVLALVLLTLLSVVTMENDDIDYSMPVSDIDVTESSYVDIDSTADTSDVFADTVSDDVSESSEAVTEKEHGWVINEFGYTYVYGDCGYEQFNYTATSMNRYIDSLNKLSELIPDGVKMYNIIAPVSSTFAPIPREVYVSDNFYNKSQSAFVSTVAAKTNERINDISLVTELEEMYDNGEYVYFRTDKNWTSLAAFTAYKSFCASAGLEPYPIAAFESTDVGDFLGSYYRATGRGAMEDNPDRMTCLSAIGAVNTSVTVYDGDLIYNEYTLCGNKVSVQTADNFYLGKSAERYEINSTATGGSLLIIGDSSAHPLIPLLASHYTIIDLINPSEFKSSLVDYLSARQYDGILTICYSTNAVSGDYIPSFNTIIGDSQNG